MCTSKKCRFSETDFEQVLQRKARRLQIQISVEFKFMKEFQVGAWEHCGEGRTRLVCVSGYKECVFSIHQANIEGESKCGRRFQ